jgi:GTPase SAR1 family protein
MLECPVVLLVGGPSVGKTRFFIQYTNSAYSYPTTKSTPNITLWSTPSFVLIDTPGQQANRNQFEYSWQGIFQYADILLDFGNWSEDEIYGNKIGYNPKYMTWSGNNEETMKRLQEYLQERQ